MLTMNYAKELRCNIERVDLVTHVESLMRYSVFQNKPSFMLHLSFSKRHGNYMVYMLCFSMEISVFHIMKAFTESLVKKHPWIQKLPCILSVVHRYALFHKRWKCM